MIAHELAHVKHRDILISSVAATLAAAIMFVARMAMLGMFGGGPRRSRPAANPLALLGHDDPRPGRGHAHPDGDLALA